MLRHLKNLDELILYASISCGAAFISRLFPAFFFPITFLRMGIFGYCIYIIAGAEKNKELAVTLGGALFLGMIGGNWDYLEVYLRYNQELIARLITVVTIISLITLGLFLYFKGEGHGKISKR